MTDMPITPAHAKPVSRRDHLWVLAIIATCALIKVSPSWVGIGAASGFPRFGGMPTDWTLAVVTDAYWAYALYAWLVAAPGPRSCRFAKWSAWGVFALSLIGQSAARLVPAAVLSAFANALPVIVLALIAFLIHLRHLDRAEAEAVADAAEQAEAQAAMERAEADERVALRAALETLEAETSDALDALDAETSAQLNAMEDKMSAAAVAHDSELEAVRDEMSAAKTARDEAQREAADAAAKVERLTRKLAAASGSGRGRSGRGKNPANGGRLTAKPAPGTQVPRDVDAQAEALAILAQEPGISGAQLGARVGKSERWGQLLKSSLATADKPEGGTA